MENILKYLKKIISIVTEYYKKKQEFFDKALRQNAQNPIFCKNFKKLVNLRYIVYGYYL